MSAEARARVLWWDDLDPPGRAVTTRPTGLDAVDTVADVVIVGAGFTGLWTAYHLLVHDPGLQVMVLDAHSVGYGASGRNGGWCTPELPLSLDAVDEQHGPGSARRWRTELANTVDDLRGILDAEGIDAHWADGGWVQLARNRAQVQRVRALVDMFRRHGFDDTAMRYLDADEASERVRATRVLGASFSAQTAAVHPTRLVHGLATAVERRGGVIVERCPVERLLPHGVVAGGRHLTARWVVRATEGYSGRFPSARRWVIPVYSMMIATEPLADEVWNELGFAGRPTFNDARHTVIYGQRTADGRLAFGGRGAPYHYASRIRDRYDAHEPTRRQLIDTVVELFPPLADVQVTHHWGGPLGVPRDWHPTVGLDPQRGWAWGGGYVGEGVVASALAGRTLADLISDRSGVRTELPWVGYRNRRWEPEPLRSLGVNAMVQVARYVDRREDQGHDISRPVTAVLDRLTGH